MKKQDVNPIIVASEFHYRFIRIHPFDDGNGRTARILMNFILMRNGFPPAIIKADDKENYYNELRLADSGMIEPFIEYIARNLISSLNIMIAGAKGENIEEPNDLDKEIALIQNRLLSLKKSGKVISEESILTVYSNICKKIILFFYDSFSKFDAFYKFHQLRLQLDNATEVGGRETVEKMEEHVTQNAKTLTCTYLFSEFRDAALSINNFNPFFFVTFDKDSIEIRSGIIGVDRFEGQAKLLKIL